MHITNILKVEPFKVLCAWNTGEIKVIDFDVFWAEWANQPDHNVLRLQDFETFKQVSLSEAGTLQWQNIPITLTFKGKQTTYPLELDAVVLYEKSLTLQHYNLTLI